MIHYVTGALGAGKSYFAVRKIARALIEGRVVVGNVELREDWAHRVARHHPVYRFGRRNRAEYVAELHRRFLYEPDLERLTRVKIRGRGEGRGLLVLDEAHNDLNNREWQREEQKEFLRWLTLARKKGLVVYMLSQHKDNTDAAARRIASVEVRLINWSQFVRVPLLGLKLLPWPVFLALAYPANLPANAFNSDKVLYRELYALGWPRKLYGTHQLFGEDDDDPDAIWLPLAKTDRAGRTGVPVGVPRPKERGDLLAVTDLLAPDERTAVQQDGRSKPLDAITARRGPPTG